MMVATCNTYLAALDGGEFFDQLEKFYGKAGVLEQEDRYRKLLLEAKKRFGDEEVFLVTSPGRTELAGNHTDHNNGMILAAAIDRDCVAVVAPQACNEIEIISEGFDPIHVNLKELDPDPDEFGKPEAIIRGTAAGFVKRGLPIQGFKACIITSIPIGCGLSSSAALEILIGSVFSRISGHDLSPLENAIIGKETENIFFGKPCGLMDQTACAFRGIVHIDFKNPVAPQVDKLFTSFRARGCQLVIVATGGDHRNLTADYAAITEEMAAVSRIFNLEYGRGLRVEDILDKLSIIRKNAGDRAAMRMLHFITENERVAAMVKALKNLNMETFLHLVRASGESSWKLLQNCCPAGAVNDQSIPLALTLSDHFLAGEGASRVHGGGFAGTIQSYVPVDRLDAYCGFMASHFGEENVFPIRIRPEGDIILEKS